MAISDEDKLYCVNNLIVMILNDLYELMPNSLQRTARFG